MAQADGVHSTRADARPKSPKSPQIKVTARRKKRVQQFDRHTRKRLEAAVERVIALMNAIDALSEDLEDGDEDGPGAALAASRQIFRSPETWLVVPQTAMHTYECESCHEARAAARSFARAASACADAILSLETR